MEGDTDKPSLIGIASDVQQCDVCLEGGSYHEAVKWCSECEQWLCVDCCQCHKLLTTTKSHILLTTNDFHKISKSMSEIERKCQKHPDNELEFYCNDHIAIVCFSCMKSDHSSCKTVNKLNDVAHGIKSSAAVTELVSKIEDSIKIFKDLETDRVNQQDNLSNKTNTIKSEIKACLSNIKTKLERAATDLQSKLQTKFANASYLMETEKRLFKKKRGQLEQKLLEVKNMVTYSSDVQMFLSLDNFNHDISMHEEYLQDLNDKIFTKTFQLEIDQNISQFENTFRSFGKISVHTELCTVPLMDRNKAMVHLHGGESPSGDHVPVSVVSPPSINIKETPVTSDMFRVVRNFEIPKPCDNDDNQNVIRDMRCLANGHIALVDTGNNRILILDQNGSVKQEERQLGNPICLTQTKDGRVAVTLSDQKYIITWNPESPTEKQTIDVDDYCTGITCLGNNLVINRHRAGLLIINLENNSRTQLPSYTGQFNLCPYKESSSTVCIYKAKTNNFILLNVLDGKELDQFKLSSKTRSCIAKDESDNFYIVGEKTVRKIEFTKKTSEIILTELDGIIKPQAVATYYESRTRGYFFSSTYMHILVANEDGDSICVFEKK